jgi:phosphoribosylformylglycinamidine synthase
MEFKINISLKSGVLDPEGKAIENALIRKGYKEVKNVKVGRLITLNIEGNDKISAYERVSQMCEDMLANNVIENFEIVSSDTNQ